MGIIVVCCVVSYLVGALPCGLWIGLIWKKVDIRELGSKNIGATNVLRVLGPGPGAVVFALDALKGMVGIVLAVILFPLVYPDGALPLYAKLLIGLCAIVGHSFSIFLRFQGGRGVSTTFGVLLALSVPVALIGLAAFLVVLFATRYVSLGSLVAAWSLPFASYWTLPDADRWWFAGVMAALAVMVSYKHRENIHRLLDGTEPKFGQRVAVEAAAAPGSVE